MTRASEVTYEAVVVECLELWATGQSTSFNNVYDRLGRRGSAAIVQKFIAQWKKDSADRLSAKRTLPDLPTDLVAASDALLGQTWAMALDQAEVAYSQARLKLESEREGFEAALERANERTGQAERDALRLTGDIQGLHAELLAKTDTLHDALRSLGDVSATLAGRDNQLVSLREDVARALITIDTERARHADELASMRDRHEQELSRAEAKHLAELGRAQEIASGEQRNQMQQTDKIRMAAKFATDGLKEQLESVRAIAESHRQEAYAARDDAANWRGRAGVLHEAVIAERARAETAEKALHTRSATETTAELENQESRA